MLDAIADFWKPIKKAPAEVKLKAEELQIGSSVGFGFVPQATLSGRRLTVTAINTYQFGTDILTSFVLSQDKDAGAALIIDDAGDGPYLAISRRISISDRTKLFTQEELDAVVHKEDAKTLACKEAVSDFKGWLVASYSREAHGIKVRLFKGDFRKTALPTQHEAQNFTYTLLVSQSREHALEIEKYDDGRVEVYATVYRRLSDIGEVSHPAIKEISRPEVKLESGGKVSLAVSNGAHAPTLSSATKVEAAEKKPEPKLSEVKPQAEKPEPAPVAVVEEVKAEPMKLQEFAAENVAAKEAPDVEVSHEHAVKVKADELLAMLANKPAITIKSNNTQPYFKQEIKAVNKEPSNFVNESIDCELHVANKIIDEAIRQEMRINDVVRRVIGLPVSQQESVQIPVTLTDQDYALLAIRYAISSSDREAIKKRINDDLMDFSGANKKKAA